jgi:hypothetical protein
VYAVEDYGIFKVPPFLFSSLLSKVKNDSNIFLFQVEEIVGRRVDFWV